MLVNSGIALRRSAGLDVSGLTLNPISRHIADEANRASVAIYCLDSRGLAVSPATPDEWADPSKEIPFSELNGSTTTMLTRQMQYVGSQDVPAILADMTGGLAFHDTNDLSGALHQIAADQSDYYLLGWDPGEKAFGFRDG